MGDGRARRPGAHVVEAAKVGKLSWRTTVTIETGARATTVQVPALVDAPATPPEAAAGTRPFWGPQRIVGVAVGGAGVVGVVVGAVFGGITFGKVSASKANGNCTPNLSTCNAVGEQLQHDANTTASVSNAAFAIGGAALVAGVVVFFTAPHADAGPAPSGAWVRVAPVADAGMTGVLVRGGW